LGELADKSRQFMDGNNKKFLTFFWRGQFGVTECSGQTGLFEVARRRGATVAARIG